MDFAELLKHHREQLGLSQQELADKAGVSRGTISALEQGRVEPMDAGVKAIIGIARALNINPLSFLVQTGLVTEDESLVLQSDGISKEEADLIRFRAERLSEDDKKLVLELMDSLARKSRFTRSRVNFRSGKFRKKDQLD